MESMYKNIYQSTTAILFFGVPFRGIYLEDVASALESDNEPGDQGLRLIQDIKYETDRITQTTQWFRKEIRDTAKKVYTFYETGTTRKFIKDRSRGYGRYGEYETVVSKDSAELGIPEYEEVFPADGDHSTIVKLKSEQDRTYKTVRSCLIRISQKRMALDELELEKLPCAESAVFDFYNYKSQCRGRDSSQLTAKCHPETRKELLHEIKEWARDPQGKSIFWLNGMAGAGKSTIARTIAESFDENDDFQLGATFFFNRGENERNSATLVFTTIAVQLSERVPALVPHIKTAIKEKPKIATGPLEQQFEMLILQPLTKLRQNSKALIFVIDALDECGEGREDEIEQVFFFLRGMQNVRTVSIKIFLTSRPELSIRQGFGYISPSIYKSITLHDEKDVPLSVIEHDLSIFLRDEFSKIRSDFIRSSCKSGSSLQLSMHWPDEKTIQKLVKLAVPSFIFAKTVVRFVGGKKPEWNPERRLKTILNCGTTGSPMDWTYFPVLRQLDADVDICESQLKEFRQEFREIIGSIVILADPLSTSSLSGLLNIDERNIDSKLYHLHSVLSIPTNPDLPVRLLHRSFREFLVDPKKRTDKEGDRRSDDFWFWIDEAETHAMVTAKCLDLLSKHLKENICSLNCSGMLRRDVDQASIEENLPKHVQYACRYWPYHLEHSAIGKPIVDDGAVHGFLCRYFLNWLEALSLLGQMYHSIALIDALRLLVDANEASKIASFLSDARRFLLQNLPIVDETPLQIYSSAIIFSPEKSIIRETFKMHIPKWIDKPPRMPQLWRPMLQKLQRHEDYVDCIAFSPNAKQLASGSYDHTIRLWDIATGQQLKTFTGHESVIKSIALIPEDNQLVSCSENGIVISWDLTTKEQAIKFETGERSRLSSSALSSDGKQLVTIQQSRCVLWDIATQRHTTLFEQSVTEFSRQVVLSPNNKKLALVNLTDDGNQFKIMLWDIDARTEREVTAHKYYDWKRRPAIAFSPDSKHLVSAYNTTVELWDFAKGQQVKSFEISMVFDNAIAFSPDGKYLALALKNNTIQLWKTTGQHVETFEGHTNLVSAVAFSPNGGEQLASAATDFSVRLWDTTQTGTALEGSTGLQTEQLSKSDIYKQHQQYVSAIAFSHHNKILATASKDSTIILWEVATKQQLNTLKGHADVVNAISFSHDNKQLASVSDDTEVKLWDVTTGQLTATFSEHNRWVTAVAFSNDGKQLASASGDKTARLWYTTGEEQTSVFELDDCGCAVTFSSDDQKLLTGSKSGTIILWNLATKHRVCFKGHNEEILAATFSPDDMQLISSSYDHTVRLWDVERGQQIHKLEIPFLIRSLRFFGDSRYLDTGRGVLDVSPTSVQFPKRPDHIFLGDEWIMRSGQNCLWLPHDYQSFNSVFKRNLLVIGGRSGAVSFFEFTDDNDSE
ncbi:hypothetical protein TWF225_001947 [Orbilia oligospora]|nr:hypothetical protein TWF751_004554 [Orbilia oligospora]KAF3190988.1 hypothetical protein TWF225_001947 [Orbilia oligospora]KAF3262169.1 hypothetical protein TWF217_004240 [Orbilia oligospora]KAF3265349.1 hypothetical protein TWF128_000615 [Orbilia oligospora]